MTPALLETLLDEDGRPSIQVDPFHIRAMHADNVRGTVHVWVDGCPPVQGYPHADETPADAVRRLGAARAGQLTAAPYPLHAFLAGSMAGGAVGIVAAILALFGF